MAFASITPLNSEGYLKLQTCRLYL